MFLNACCTASSSSREDLAEEPREEELPTVSWERKRGWRRWEGGECKHEAERDALPSAGEADGSTLLQIWLAEGEAAAALVATPARDAVSSASSSYG